MHNSLNGASISPSSAVGAAPGNALLLASDASSVCLNCHAGIDAFPGGGNPNSHHILSLNQPIPTERTPGGDFAWLKKSWTWYPIPSDPASLRTSPGERHGHNIVATDYGYLPDMSTASFRAPGGTYPNDQLHCISCHDPHGKYRKLSDETWATSDTPIVGSGSYGADAPVGGAVGAYRLLGGVNYQPASLLNVPAFTNAPMTAAVESSYNRSEDMTEVPVAYGKGASEWCANCHATIHTLASGSSFTHAAGVSLGETMASTYNNYVKTGDLSGLGGGFTSLVPVQRSDLLSNSALYTQRLDQQVLPIDTVTCLTCHRAHASGWDYMLRFPYGTDFMTVADLNGDPIYPDPLINPAEAMGRTPAEFQAALYDRPATRFAAFQTSLCDKCHTP
jgi:hypothetical protein